MKENRIFLSVIIPIFNEVKRLDSIPKVFEYLKTKSFSSELILVDDGSGEKTNHALKELAKQYHFQLLSYIPNMGKGYAIKKGMLFAHGKYRLFTDLDLSTPIEELEKFLPLLSQFDVLIGSRKMKGAFIEEHQGIIRERMGKMFTFLSQRTLGLSVSDFTCGFKCFSQEAAEKIFGMLTINRWGFDSELLFLAKKMNFSTKEIPVRWKNEPNSRVRFPQDVIGSFFELLKIRLNDSTGKYSV